jgi:ankyrin repeat protein
MTRKQRADRLKQALYFGQTWVAERLLAEDPALPDHDFGLQVATYDVKAVRDRLEKSPSAATEVIGVRRPILHLAYSHYFRMVSEKTSDMLEIAAQLVTHGADVNDGYAPEMGSDHRTSALYGALGHADNLVLARWLLEQGASPDDNESLYHATELGHCDGLKLLIEFGVSTRGTNALPRALDFNDAEAVQLLLDHGADPNEAVSGHPSGQPVDMILALHQAARRKCSAEIGGLLLDHGADPSAVWQGHTPYATARLYGNKQIAGLLTQRGYATGLSSTEKVLAECAQGRVPSTRLDPKGLTESDRRLLTQLVSDTSSRDHVKALVAIGLDPDECDEMGLTPLHIAGWEGLPDHVGYLLTLNPDLALRNAYGGDALGTVVHGSEFCKQAPERDHITCARLLLEAGSPLRPEMAGNCGNEELAVFLESWKGD